MLADGRWGTVGEGEDDRISAETARRWDPHARGVHLLATPVALADDLAGSPRLAELWNTTGVDPRRCVVIGDFGVGSDNPIVLGFAVDPPAVRTLSWSDQPGGRPVWITIAPTFKDFVTELGLVDDPAGSRDG
jgi:hypothetical protein